MIVPGGAGKRLARGPLLLEKVRLRLGIVPLTDCAPIVVAKKIGLFAKHGLEVEISCEPSWASIRDKVALGALDGAQMLAAMPLATTLGIGGVQKAQITALGLSLNGNAVTVSNRLFARMLEIDPEACLHQPLSPRALKRIVDADREAGRAPLIFAMVFPFSSHNYELRCWLASAGIDLDQDVRLVVVPPPKMVEALAAGEIDGYCVGEPWNQQAVLAGLGRVITTSYEIWNNRLEKVFGVNLEWAERHPNTHQALIMALLEAAEWADRPENRLRVATMLARPEYVDAPLEVLKLSMLGTYPYRLDSEPEAMPDFNVFFRYAANFPWRSQAEWYLTQMRRWRQAEDGIDVAGIADAVFRPDLYRTAAAALGLAYPTIDRKPEGLHAGPWTLAAATWPMAMGSDAFFDGSTFFGPRPEAAAQVRRAASTRSTKAAATPR